jgi:broad specificity phosphatase PhoE
MSNDTPDSSPSQTIWICRHGQRIDQVDPTWRRKNGQDPHLSAAGIRQAQETGQRLQFENISYIFCSPFLRTVETAHYVAEILRVPIFVERGLSEWLNLRWFDRMPQTIPVSELAKQFPRLQTRYESLVTPNYPETAEEAFVRASRTSQALANRCPGNLLLVGHGHSVVGMSWGLLAGRPRIQAGLCALVKIERQNGRWHLALNGDTAHLSGGERA